MKIIYYSDVHFRERGSFQPWNRQEGRFTKELQRILTSMYWLADLIELEKPDLVVCLGDVFHNLQMISSSVLDATGLAFSRLKEVCSNVGCEHWLIPGNHDFYGRYDNSIYSIRVLEGFFNRIFYEPVYEDNVLYLPYYTDEVKAYEEILLKEPKKIITHLTFNGVNVGKIKMNGLTLPKGVKAVSGHIHIPQEAPEFLYPGSLVQLSWIEGTKHGVYIEEKGKYRFVKNPASKQIIKISFIKKIEEYDIKNVGFILETSEIPSSLPSDVDIQVRLIKEQSKEISVEYDVDSFESPLKLLEEEIKDEYPEKIDLLKSILKE